MALFEIPQERHSFISELALDVWDKYSRERQVFLDGIIESVDSFDLTLSYGEYGDAFDGLIEHKSNAFHIYCNTARGQPIGSPRARFTIAHELGHFFIDEHRNALLAGRPPHSSFTENPADNRVEAEANLFSANLLMPTREYRKALLEVPAGLIGIVETASTFGVSIQSSALRFTGISGRPCAIIMFREGGKTPWWDISPELKAHGFEWVRKLSCETIPEDSATGLAFRDSTTVLGPVHQSGTVASAWFTRIITGGIHDEMFMESARRLGSRGVLTLLEPSPLRR